MGEKAWGGYCPCGIGFTKWWVSGLGKEIWKEREGVPASADIKGGNGLEEKCGNEVEEGGCPRKNFVNQTQGSGLPAWRLQVTFSVDAITY